jgi:hypothetical protein
VGGSSRKKCHMWYSQHESKIILQAMPPNYFS